MRGSETENHAWLITLKYQIRLLRPATSKAFEPLLFQIVPEQSNYLVELKKIKKTKIKKMNKLINIERLAVSEEEPSLSGYSLC